MKHNKMMLKEKAAMTKIEESASNNVQTKGETQKMKDRQANYLYTYDGVLY